LFVALTRNEKIRLPRRAAPVDLAVNLSHRVVPIGHVEQFFNAVHQGTLKSAGDAVAGQETMEAKHRGGL